MSLRKEVILNVIDYVGENENLLIAELPPKKLVHAKWSVSDWTYCHTSLGIGIC